MNTKIIAVFALFLLIIGQILLAQGAEFQHSQAPLDWTHWILLLAAVFSIAFSFAFPSHLVNTIATTITILGIIATVGMCAIDFVFWSFGDDQVGRNKLIIHLMDTPVIWIPFFVIGPSLLYIGLATHIWQFIRSYTLLALMTLAGSMAIGLGHFIYEDRNVVIIGTIIMSLGLTLLLFREQLFPKVAAHSN